MFLEKKKYAAGKKCISNWHQKQRNLSRKKGYLRKTDLLFIEKQPLMFYKKSLLLDFFTFLFNL